MDDQLGREQDTVVGKQVSLKIPAKLRLPILLSSIIIPAISLLVLYRLNVFSNVVLSLYPSPSPLTPASSPQPSVSAIPSPTPSPSPVFVDKDLLKVRIFNGTGIRGQAGMVGDRMAQIGFKNITTANTTRRTDEAEVSFSKNVSPEIRNEIYKTLGDIFITVAQVPEELSHEYDVEITTGR